MAVVKQDHMNRLPLRVAIIGTNDPRNVSGGRYHALMLAYAVAAAGGEAHVVTDHIPGFMPDLEPLAPKSVRYHRSSDFANGLPEGNFDWVLVIPTGIFLPDFYENSLDFAARAQARVVLVNFESANWFNECAPEPRDPRLWDYWRRIVMRGGLVLSATRLSDRHARAFYRAPSGQLRFEVWSPPVNSLAAQRFDGTAKDGSILAFIRPQDRHKNSALIAAIEPRLLRGRTLNLVSGLDVPAEFETAVRDHCAAAGARLEILRRISDLEKFRLLAAAQAVLFPSRFEGYGYPPVEAAYAGTESVCFRLPVLEETVGSIAHFAAGGSAEDFNQALAAALAEPERRAMLRQAVFSRADFPTAALRLADILYRSLDAVAPLAPRTWRVALGPWAGTSPLSAERIDRGAALPPLPSHATGATRSAGGDVLISARALLPADFDRLEAADPAGLTLPVICQRGATVGDCADTLLHIVAPAGILGRRISITSWSGGRQFDTGLALRVDHATDADPGRPGRCFIAGNSIENGQRQIRGAVLARAPLDEILISLDGKHWHGATGFGERRDIFDKHKNYPTARCEFSISVPAEELPDPQAARLLCLAGGVAIDLLTGWEPSPHAHFAAESPTPAARPQPPRRAAAPAAAAPAFGRGEPDSVSRREPAPRQPPLRRKLGEVALLDCSEPGWDRGVATRGDAGRLGAVLFSAAESLRQGQVLAFASGTVRRIAALERNGDRIIAVLNAPLLPEANHAPAKAVLYAAEDPDWNAAQPSFTPHAGNGSAEQRRHSILLDAALAHEIGLHAKARLRFAASGERQVTALRQEGGLTRVTLDAAIKPMADGAPRLVTLLNPSLSTRPGAIGVLSHGQRGGFSQWLLDTAPGQIAPGGVLRTGTGRMALVVDAEPAGGGLLVTLDTSFTPASDELVFAVDPVDVPDGVPLSYRHPDARYAKPDPLPTALIHAARATGQALPLQPPAEPGRKRALFATLVPPAPATQGNRVVTRNLIAHLVDQGFDVDVVLQGSADDAAVRAEFGNRVRVFTVPFPQWDQSDAVRNRQAMAALAAGTRDSGLAAAIAAEAEYFHPYFIVRDELVEHARHLYRTHRYDTLVCNYTHMARVAEELAEIAPLPPVAIITHDALSQLPRAVLGRKLDLSYRLCKPAVERGVLDAVPGAVVVAISRQERDYFKSLGVTNRLVLCEYDAAREMAPFATRPENFGRRTMLFHGSANPMNLAALDWFIDECWDQITAAVPDAKLVVCGKIGTLWNPDLAGIEVKGELERDAMLALCAEAAITINPCVAGTGLKIKTVESACCGLPAVVLPKAVDGLEDIASRLAIVARDAGQFAEGCITLLTDRARWLALRQGALDTAAQCFSAATVYRALDSAMGWTARQAKPRKAKPAAAEAQARSVHLFDLPLSNPRAALFRAGLDLGRNGHFAHGWPMIEHTARHLAGDLRLALASASFALRAGKPWAAAIYAAAAAASDPTDGRGYRLLGEALLGLDQPDQALAALIQGASAAPDDQALPALIAQTLATLGRDAEAARWRKLRLPSLVAGQYTPLNARQFPRHGLPGWRVAENGDLSFAAEPAVLSLLAAPAPDGSVALTVDLAVNQPGLNQAGLNQTGPVALELAMNGIKRKFILEASAPFHSVRLAGKLIAKNDEDGADGAAVVRLAFRAPGGAVVQLIGVTFQPDPVQAGTDYLKGAD